MSRMVLILIKWKLQLHKIEWAASCKKVSFELPLDGAGSTFKFSKDDRESMERHSIGLPLVWYYACFKATSTPL